MGVRSVGTLAAKRRGAGPGGAAAAGAGDTAGASTLEAAVPTEVITLYTAIIAAATAAERSGDYLPFRVAVYVLGLAATAWTTLRAVSARIAVSGRGGGTPHTDAVRSAELWTAMVAFAAWGAVLPGSFLYAALSGGALSLTVTTITATVAFVLAVIATPRLNGSVSPKRGAGPPTTTAKPGAGPPPPSAKHGAGAPTTPPTPAPPAPGAPLPTQ